MINPNTIFLVSGGARGITAQCVIRLAQAYRCKFILVGRSAINDTEPAWAANCTDEATLKKGALAAMQAHGERPKPADIQKAVRAILAQREVLATLQSIRQAGSQAEYICADIGNQQALQQVLVDVVGRLGPVTGIIHGAGVLADKPIQRKLELDFDRVYGVKVRGLQNLLACIPPDQLNYLILFSSAAGFYGNVGQTDYALANEILNKAAFQVKRNHPECQVLALNWGPWDGGMVTPELKRYFTEHNVDLISVAGGAQFLVDQLKVNATNQPAIQLVVGGSFGTTANTAVDPTLQTHRIQRALTEAANPFLQDHVIGQHAVLPMVCSVAWVTNAAEQLYPGFQMSKVENFKVLKGIVFDETLSTSYTLDLKELAKNDTEIVFDALVWSESASGTPRYHYKTQLVLHRQLPTAPSEVLDFDVSQPTVIYTKSDLYQSGMLFHGPSFQGVQRVLDIGPDRLVLEGCLPKVSETQQGQFPVQHFNPYIADVQFQSLVIWARHIYQAGSLPLSCQLGEQFKPIQFDEIFYVVLEVQSSTDFKLVTNLLTYNQQGQLCSRLVGAEVTISKQLNHLFLGQEA